MPVNETRLRARTYRANWRNRIRKTLKKDPDLLEIRLLELPSIDDVEEFLHNEDLTRDYITGQRIPASTMELDHKNPISRGGSLELENIGPLTKRNNKMKGELTDNEYSSLVQLMNSWTEIGKKVLEKRLNQSTLIFKPKAKK